MVLCYHVLDVLEFCFPLSARLSSVLCGGRVDSELVRCVPRGTATGRPGMSSGLIHSPTPASLMRQVMEIEIAVPGTDLHPTPAVDVPIKATPLWPLRPKCPGVRFTANAMPMGFAMLRARSSNHSRRVVTFFVNLSCTVWWW